MGRGSASHAMPVEEWGKPTSPWQMIHTVYAGCPPAYLPRGWMPSPSPKGLTVHMITPATEHRSEQAAGHSPSCELQMLVLMRDRENYYS